MLWQSQSWLLEVKNVKRKVNTLETNHRWITKNKKLNNNITYNKMKIIYLYVMQANKLTSSITFHKGSDLHLHLRFISCYICYTSWVFPQCWDQLNCSNKKQETIVRRWHMQISHIHMEFENIIYKRKTDIWQIPPSSRKNSSM